MPSKNLLIKSFLQTAFARPAASEDGEATPAQIDVITSFQELFEKVKVRDMPKHSLFSVPLHLGPGFSIGVKAYLVY